MMQSKARNRIARALTIRPAQMLDLAAGTGCDDHATPTLDHLRRRRLAQDPRAYEIDVEDAHKLAEPRIGGLLHVGAAAGIIDQDVDRAELLLRLFKQAPRILGIGEIGLEDHGPAAVLLNLPGSLLCALAVAVVMDDHIGSFARESDGDRLADPAVRAGHQGDFSREFHRPFLS